MKSISKQQNTIPCLENINEILNKDVLMARQSILTSSHQIFGFEVLYRGTSYDVTNPKHGLGATGELLTNIYTCVNEEGMAQEHKVFVNIDENFIHSPSFFPSCSEQIVLEILETVPATPKVIQKVKELKRLGFEFALDDYVFEPKREAFLPLVSIVKVDLLACSVEQLQEKLDSLKQYNFTLLAEKVESLQVFEQCKNMGFKLFQGYYLERPQLVHGVKIPSNKQIILRLLSELTRADITVKEVADLITCDPRLAMKILLLVNSSLFSFVRKIADVREAVVMLGIEAVKRWAIILILVAESEQPVEIFRTLLSRAKTLELYANETAHCNPSEYFCLGLFSAIDAVLGIEMQQVTESLPLSNQLTDALTSNDGVMGQILLLLIKLERGVVSLELSDPITKDLNSFHWQGLRWADELIDNII